MALTIQDLLGLGSNTSNDPIQVGVTPALNLGVGGMLLGADGQPLQVDLGGQLGLGQNGLLDLGNLLGVNQDGLLELNSLVGPNGLVDVNDLLNLDGIVDGGVLSNLNDLVSGAVDALDPVVGTVGDVIGQVQDILPTVGVDIDYHGPGAGPGGPTNPPPSSGSDGVRIFHTANGDILIGTAAGDTMTGNVGNDHFFGLDGNDSIDGGFGIDAAFFRGGHGDYAVTSANGQITVSDQMASRDGVDTLANVERVAFTDSTLAFDINGDAGQAYRLYQAAFDRTPDQPGVSFWTGRLDHGETLKQVAAEFVNSQEFHAKYGVNPSNATFINALYQNVLDRPADAAGIAYWTNAMNQGQTRGDVLASFSESAENHANVDPGIQHGILLDYGVYV